MSTPLSGLSIMIIEDSASMQRLVGSILRTLGIKRIYMVGEGKRAWDIYQSERPDIIICDWLLEDGMDGIGFTHKVRRDPLSIERTVPIIMMSGYSARKRVIEARDAGVTEFLAKPFTADELAKRITHVIEKPRDFIQCATFFGPDRRRRQDPDYQGPPRRTVDKEHLTTKVYDRPKEEKKDEKLTNNSDISFK